MLLHLCGGSYVQDSVFRLPLCGFQGWHSGCQACSAKTSRWDISSAPPCFDWDSLSHWPEFTEQSRLGGQLALVSIAHPLHSRITSTHQPSFLQGTRDQPRPSCLHNQHLAGWAVPLVPPSTLWCHLSETIEKLWEEDMGLIWWQALVMKLWVALFILDFNYSLHHGVLSGRGQKFSSLEAVVCEGVELGEGQKNNFKRMLSFR